MGKATRKPIDARIGSRVDVRLTTGETYTGRLLAADHRDGTVVLSDAEKARVTKAGAVLRSPAGFVILRGFAVVSVQVPDAASAIGWAAHNDSLVAMNTTAVDYAAMMRQTGALQQRN